MECRCSIHTYRHSPSYKSLSTTCSAHLKRFYFAIEILKKFGKTSIKEIKTWQMTHTLLLIGGAFSLSELYKKVQIAIHFFFSKLTFSKDKEEFFSSEKKQQKEMIASSAQSDELDLSAEESEDETIKKQFKVTNSDSINTKPISLHLENALIPFIIDYLDFSSFKVLFQTASCFYKNEEIWKNLGQRLHVNFTKDDKAVYAKMKVAVCAKMKVLLDVFEPNFKDQSLGKVKMSFAKAPFFLSQSILSYPSADTIFYPSLINCLSLPFDSEDPDIKKKIDTFFLFFDAIPSEESNEAAIHLKKSQENEDEKNFIIKALETFPKSCWYMHPSHKENCYHFYYREHANSTVSTLENVNTKCHFSVRMVESTKIINNKDYKEIKTPFTKDFTATKVKS